MRTVPWLALSFSCTVAGCDGGRVEVRNPLAERGTIASTIAKPRRALERQRRLPAGSLTAFVSLDRLDPTSICLDVVLRGLAPIDLRQVGAVLVVPSAAPLEQAELWPQEPTHADHAGLVMQQVEHGFETECATHDHAGICLTWTTKPTYRTVARPGIVRVHEARGRLCYPNASFVTPATSDLRLVLAVPGDARETFDWRLTSPRHPQKENR